MSLLKKVLPFLANQAARFISRGIRCSYFSGNFILSFLLWYYFNILFKSSGAGYMFKSSIVCKRLTEVVFFQLKAKYPVFHFLDLDETILILIQPKINKIRRNFHCFFKFCYLTPCMTFEYWFRSIN